MAVDETNELVRQPSSVRLHKAQTLSVVRERQHQPLPWHKIGEHLGRNIRSDIAIVIEVDDLATDGLPQPLWPRVRELHDLRKARTKVGRLYPLGQVGRHGTKDVTAMKRCGHL